jgi:hypothetical protein
VFRHVVVFRWRPEVSADAIAEISDALAALPSAIPQIVDFRFGPDAGLAATNFDFAVVADFTSADGFTTYRDHPSHRAVVDRLLVPSAAERVAVQYEF